MDSRPSTSSSPQSSGMGSPSPSRFRLTELLTSSPRERPRTASLKDKQTQQESSSRIYGLSSVYPSHSCSAHSNI